MIIETEQEAKALKFVFKLAERATDRICNDLETKEQEQFKDMKVFRSEVDGELVEDDVKYDFDVIHWLKNRCRDKPTKSNVAIDVCMEIERRLKEDY